MGGSEVLQESDWVRLRQVALVAKELGPVVDDLQGIFGLEVAFNDPGVATFGLENAVLPVGHQFVEVVAPTRPGTAAGRQLERRGGEGGYMVITHTDDHPRRRQRAAELGVRTVLEFDEGAYHCMQLHPADTGGSFFEIDWQDGGADPSGPWAPAGPDWQRAVHTDVVAGILGVEIETSDPERVAQRWADLVEVDPRREGDGVLVVALDNADIRFVAGDGTRGDGLTGVRLDVVDWERATAEAERRGRLNPEGYVTVCGTRFAP